MYFLIERFQLILLNKKQLKFHHLKKLRGIPDSVIKAGIGLAVMFGLLYFGYTVMKGRDLAEKQQEQQEQQEEQKKKEEEDKKTLDPWKIQVEQK
jgi:cell division protein FtsB